MGGENHVILRKEPGIDRNQLKNHKLPQPPLVSNKPEFVPASDNPYVSHSDHSPGMGTLFHKLKEIPSHFTQPRPNLDFEDAIAFKSKHPCYKDSISSENSADLMGWLPDDASQRSIHHPSSVPIHYPVPMPPPSLLDSKMYPDITSAPSSAPNFSSEPTFIPGFASTQSPPPPLIPRPNLRPPPFDTLPYLNATPTNVSPTVPSPGNILRPNSADIFTSPAATFGHGSANMVGHASSSMSQPFSSIPNGPTPSQNPAHYVTPSNDPRFSRNDRVLNFNPNFTGQYQIYNYPPSDSAIWVRPQKNLSSSSNGSSSSSSSSSGGGSSYSSNNSRIGEVDSTAFRHQRDVYEPNFNSSTPKLKSSARGSLCDSDNAIAQILQEELNASISSQNAATNQPENGLYSSSKARLQDGNTAPGIMNIKNHDGVGTRDDLANPTDDTLVNDRMIALTLAQEEGSDPQFLPKEYAEIKNRLSRLESIPHTMRVNNSQMPSYDDVMNDHARLLQRLHDYGLAERKVEGDGNCQFRALSDQLYFTPDKHALVRKRVYQQLKCCSSLYKDYVPGDFNAYVKRMSKNGEWGDHITLQAAADCFFAKITLVTSYREKGMIQIVPQKASSRRELWLSFWAEIHYNSIFAKEDLAPQGQKKKHWLFK